MPVLTHDEAQFRPASYWDSEGLLRSLYANIKGTARRARVKHLVETGQLGQLFAEADAEGELDRVVSLFAPGLSENDRKSLGSIHPFFMGGEYLPPSRHGEVEIARVQLKSTTWDVISVLARPLKGWVGYRIVDEYETRFRCRPARSKRLLTLAQLIRLMDTATRIEYDGDGPKLDPDSDYTTTGIVEYYRDYIIRCDCFDETLVDFVTVSSEFYPRLASYYEEQAGEWVERWRRICGLDEED
jgi:hypothetical protein